MTDPKKGTGKKPKGSKRRLYTDENPKDTVSIKFATPADARATVAKVKKVNKPYARKIQILTVMEQRAKVMKKTQVVNIAKKAKASAIDICATTGRFVPSMKTFRASKRRREPWQVEQGCCARYLDNSSRTEFDSVSL